MVTFRLLRIFSVKMDNLENSRRTFCLIRNKRCSLPKAFNLFLLKIFKKLCSPFFFFSIFSTTMIWWKILMLTFLCNLRHLSEKWGSYILHKQTKKNLASSLRWLEENCHNNLKYGSLKIQGYALLLIRTSQRENDRRF